MLGSAKIYFEVSIYCGNTNCSLNNHNVLNVVAKAELLFLCFLTDCMMKCQVIHFQSTNRHPVLLV